MANVFVIIDNEPTHIGTLSDTQAAKAVKAAKAGKKVRVTVEVADSAPARGKPAPAKNATKPAPKVPSKAGRKAPVRNLTAKLMQDRAL